MARKVRTTAFTKFIIFLFFIVPLAYGAALYINGQDPIAKFKDLLGIEQTETTVEKSTPSDQSYTISMDEKGKASVNKTSADTMDEVEKEIKYLKAKIEKLEAENERLEKEPKRRVVNICS